MLKNYLIAHDLGTSGNKAVLVTADGKIVRSHSVSYPVDKTLPGHAEQNPRLWWDAFCQCNQALLEGLDSAEVAGVSLCSQMMCCLPVDRDGGILHPAIIWADHRACQEAEWLEVTVGRERYYQIVGMRASANYSLPKILWLKNHRPELYRNTYKILNPKDYINYLLTGRIATDPETAAYMHCFDWRAKDWSPDILAAAGVDVEKLPELMETGSVLGAVTSAAAQVCSLAAGTTVVMGIGDGGAATLGTATIEPGEAYTSLGSSSWVCVVTGSKKLDPDRSISKLNFLNTQRDSGTMQAGGYSYSWLRDTLCWQERQQAKLGGEKDYVLIDRLAEQASPGAGGVLFLPYLFGERSPYWDTKLRGAFLGITARTERSDLCRSVLEGVSMHLGLILDRIRQVNSLGDLRCMKLVGGGANSPLWRQIFADVYGLPVTTTDQSDQAGALGVAAVAGVAVGMYPDLHVVKQFQQVTSITEPDPKKQLYYRQLSELFSDAHVALKDLNHRLTDLTWNG
ncbi:MAG: FGGY-family carbohydrate kinase [Negativicutes bacterium]|nr:FGGY-family carbohydrate kinase [Negativicutes bacterium]